jgi:biotin transport system permease protein
MAATVQLAAGRPQGRRLILAAAGFWLFWSLLLLLAHLALSPAGLKPALNLAVWLNLGLLLILAKTPLELALASVALLGPIMGRPRAQKLALALALLTRLIPALLASALALRTVLGRRAAGLPLYRRMSLWGRGLVRDALAQSEELARALTKRWPW